MKVAFRADASYEIGSGHIMRCFTLAQALRIKGIDVFFICRMLPGNLASFLESNKFKTYLLPGPKINFSPEKDDVAHAAWLGFGWDIDANETADVIKNENVVDYLIIDHYGVDNKWEKKLQHYVKKIVVIDDLADRCHDCDILIDQNYYHDLDERYKKLVPSNCEMFLGPKYTLLRSEFIDARNNIHTNISNINRIFVFFGGMDTSNETSKVLLILKKILRDFKYNFYVDVVVSNSNLHSDEIHDICENESNFNFYSQVNNISELMAIADLAVGAGGTTAFERIFVLLPAVVKIIADNQKIALQDLKDIGAVDLYQTQEELFDKLEHVLQNGLNSMPDIVNIGTNYIAGILDTRTKLISPVGLDVRRAYIWLQDDDLRKDFLMSIKPSLTQHFVYWRKQLLSKTDFLKSIYFLDDHVGFCGIKEIDKINETGEIWIYLGEKKNRSAGIGTTALSQLINQFRKKFTSFKKLSLHVNKNNYKAVRTYKKLGFKDVGIVDDSVWYANKDEMSKMELIL